MFQKKNLPESFFICSGKKLPESSRSSESHNNLDGRKILRIDKNLSSLVTETTILTEVAIRVNYSTQFATFKH